MERHYYENLRRATQEDYYEAINSQDHELYDVLWELFETVVIEPAEVFDSEFGEKNQFRYSINSAITLEFFPDSSYFESRFGSNPYRDGSDPAGIHLQFTIQPEMSCLFSVGLQIWGSDERRAFQNLWSNHRKLIASILRMAKPMVEKRMVLPAMEHASTLEEMLDRYFAVQDSEDFLELSYPFAQFDESESAQNFMIYMSMLYHLIREQCQYQRSDPSDAYAALTTFFSGHLPVLNPPLPCVSMAITSDTE